MGPLPRQKNLRMRQLIDPYGRKIDYLRLSVTDRCNLNCYYCSPPASGENTEKVFFVPKENLLFYEELLRLVKIFLKLGIRKIRITGGEPLVRKGIIDFIQLLSNIPELEELSITTNGQKLKEELKELKKSKVKQLNVSLDSLNPLTYRLITQGELKPVLEGIRAAKNFGFVIKINVVALKGLNSIEILDFVKFADELESQVRFIEYMPLCGNKYNQKYFISSDEIKEIIGKSYILIPLKRDGANGVAKVYRIPGNRGEVGFITPMSAPFCDSCSRLRLTAQGELYTCLFGDNPVMLSTLIRNGDSDEKIEEVIKIAIGKKSQTNPLLTNEECGVRSLEYGARLIGG